jgi:hypothetical protein
MPRAAACPTILRVALPPVVQPFGPTSAAR